MYKKSTQKINVDCATENIKSILNELLPGFVKSDFKVKSVNGGASNILFVAFNGDKIVENETEAILFRVYGDVPLDRDQETRNMVILSKYELAEEVIGQFDNGVCYRYIHGYTLEIPQFHDENIYPLIIKEMVKLHSLKLDNNDCLGDRKPVIIDQIRDFTNKMPDNFRDDLTNEKYHAVIPKKYQIHQYIDQIEEKLMKLHPTVSFCHNDILIGNCILNYKKDRIHFIDFEYGGYSFSAFDIGNHFNEFAGFHNPDYSYFPEDSFQKIWILEYLKQMGFVSKDNEDVVLERWFQSVQLCILLSHLLWCVWAIWQQWKSDIEVDYIEYAIIRWKEFEKKVVSILK